MRRTHFERIGLVAMKLRYIRIHNARYGPVATKPPRIQYLRNRMRRYAAKSCPIWTMHYRTWLDITDA
jgi:hypothetical protein